LLRDGDGGAEGFLGPRRTRRVHFQQDFASKAMEEAVRPAFSGLGRQRERAVDPAQGAFADLAFDVASRPWIEWHVQLAFLPSEDRTPAKREPSVLSTPSRHATSRQASAGSDSAS